MQRLRPASSTHSPRASIRGVVAALAVLVQVGCEDSDIDARSAVDVDLGSFGVAEVTREGAGRYRLLDDAGAELGRVEGTLDGERVELRATFAGQVGSFAWSDADASATCERGTGIADAADGAPLDACRDALDVGARVAAAEGSRPPWAADTSDAPQLRASCQNTSAWVWGSSCSDCIWASGDAFIAAQNVPEGVAISFQPGTYQCSSGTVYTTCSRTWCWSPPQLD